MSLAVKLKLWEESKHSGCDKSGTTCCAVTGAVCSLAEITFCCRLVAVGVRQGLLAGGGTVPLLCSLVTDTWPAWALCSPGGFAPEACCSLVAFGTVVVFTRLGTSSFVLCIALFWGWLGGAPLDGKVGLKVGTMAALVRVSSLLDGGCQFWELLKDFGWKVGTTRPPLFAWVRQIKLGTSWHGCVFLSLWSTFPGPTCGTLAGVLEDAAVTCLNGTLTPGGLKLVLTGAGLALESAV